MENSNSSDRFVGVDFHQKTTVVTRLRPDGSRIGKTETFPSTREGLEKFRATCGANDHVVVEATYHWALFADVFDQFEGELVLAHPYKNRLIAESRNKNDKVDSRVLAELRRTNFLAQAWIAPRNVREERELLRYRSSLVCMQTMLRNRVRVILAKAGASIEAADIFGIAAMVALEKMDLGPVRNQIIKGYLEVARQIKAVLNEVLIEIKRRVKDSPQAQLLKQIKGIGDIIAPTILAEIGDVHRFRNAKKLVSYAGLAPTNRESAGVLRHGPITKQGSPWLRWVLVEAVQHAIEAYPQLRRLYERVSANQGGRKNAGRIAVARQLLVSVYYVLKRNQPFEAERIGPRGEYVRQKK